MKKGERKTVTVAIDKVQLEGAIKTLQKLGYAKTGKRAAKPSKSKFIMEVLEEFLKIKANGKEESHLPSDVGESDQIKQ